MAKKKSQGKILNRRAQFDYDLKEGVVVGLVLTGAETKSLRRGHGHLRGAYITVKDNELWLINATITGDNAIKIEDSDQTRARKVLAKRKQIDELIAVKKQGLSIIPTEIINKGRFIKLRIASGRGKKHYDKRDAIKKRDQDRESARLFR